MTTFDLSAAVLAHLKPVIETDPAVLRSWADNLDLAGAAYDRTGCTGLGDAERDRAKYLRSLALVREGVKA